MRRTDQRPPTGRTPAATKGTAAVAAATAEERGGRESVGRAAAVESHPQRRGKQSQKHNHSRPIATGIHPQRANERVSHNPKTPPFADRRQTWAANAAATAHATPLSPAAPPPPPPPQPSPER
ncbi:hypothetical protein I4F81_012870 [Pyropia yezoensis]|uniref:Uncharacterized protein n=1 Tax=Pyropia yezoensis TaxID=2788 RepID=A0ACC3CK32_PYRYE|nr:hypothetical protein I4F81_012870 [Neopyropia yezoensis]